MEKINLAIRTNHKDETRVNSEHTKHIQARRQLSKSLPNNDNVCKILDAGRRAVRQVTRYNDIHKLISYYTFQDAQVTYRDYTRYRH